MRYTRSKALALSVLSSCLMALAMPNEFLHWGSPFIGLFALAPLFVALSISPTPGFAFLVGGVFGFLTQAMTSYWLWFFKDFRIWTLGPTAIVYFFVYGGVGAWLSIAAKSSKPFRPLLLALGWIAYELMKSNGFLAYPWCLIAYSWNTVLPFNQIADLTGVYGPSLVLALTNAFLSELVLRWQELFTPFASRDSRKTILAFGLTLVGIYACVLGYGAFRLSEPERVVKTLNAIMVQPNEDSWRTFSETKRLESLIKLSEDAIARAPARPDLIMWTENTLDGPYDEAAASYYSRVPKGKPLTAFIKEHGIPLITGSPKILSWENGEAQNAVMLIDGEAAFAGYYAKLHPVPFAEVIPFWEYKWMRDFMEKAVGMRGAWTIGDTFVNFYIPLGSGGELRFASPICFEDAFADLCREYVINGAEAYLNLTNDSWSKTVSAELQHAVAARYRSIENRRVLIRSTNAGLSCWVDAKGRIHDALPLFEATSRAVSVPITLPARETAYTRSNDAFAVSILVFFVAASAILYWRPFMPKVRRIDP